MLTLNDFSECLRNVCLESTLFLAVPKPDVNFVADLVKQQTDEVLNIFATFTIGLVDQLILRIFFG